MTASAASPGTATTGFDPRVILAVVVAGVIGFIALLGLSAISPSMNAPGGGGTPAHAQTRGASGYAGVAALLQESGWEVYINEEHGADLGRSSLRVLTPSIRTPDDLFAEVYGTLREPTLIILPKWQASPDRRHRGWQANPVATAQGSTLLVAAKVPGKVSITIPRGTFAGMPARARALHAPTLKTVIAHPGGGAILARSEGRPRLWVLVEPDYVNNLALATDARAAEAVNIFDLIMAYDELEDIYFDMTLHGAGAQRSLLRYAFVPPFLGVTLCLIAAGLVVGWSALGRFGSPRLVPRALPLSKDVLIDNAAALVAQAGREDDVADRYLVQMREAAARALHIPADLNRAATDARLDRATRGSGPRFTDLAAALTAARTPHDVLAATRALAQWRKDTLP